MFDFSRYKILGVVLLLTSDANTSIPVWEGICFAHDSIRCWIRRKTIKLHGFGREHVRRSVKELSEILWCRGGRP